ncbi:MAG: hypothetical protein RL157_194 [Bacteroidota bacterium]
MNADFWNTQRDTALQTLNQKGWLGLVEVCANLQQTVPHSNGSEFTG